MKQLYSISHEDLATWLDNLPEDEVIETLSLDRRCLIVRTVKDLDQ